MRRLGATATVAAGALGLAAAPALALMAALTAGGGGGPLDAICSARTPWGGMATMYLLMSAFHLPPWLRLLGGLVSRAGPRRSEAPEPARHRPAPPASYSRQTISDC